MMRAIKNDLDYLAARLHGRRCRLAEGERLDELCRLGGISELARTLYPEREIRTANGLQRRWVSDLAGEFVELAAFLTGAGAQLLTWMLARFQVENVKLLLRGFTGGRPLESLERHLISLPAELGIHSEALAAAGSLAEFVRLLPAGPLRESLDEFVQGARDPPRLFFLEAALDRGYYRELLDRARRISGEDRKVVAPLVFQEADLFHLMLVVRGRFFYGLEPEILRPFHVKGTELSRSLFIRLLSAPDLLTGAGSLAGLVLDRLPTGLRESSASPDSRLPALLEACAWNRYLGLAERAFRRSHMGLGAVIGYAGIRRVEVANLITLSEGLRAGLPAEVIRGRLTPRSEREVAHV